MKPRVSVISLGCPRNLVDSETILGCLNSKGYTVTDSIEDADVGIINTCGFIQDAKVESIDVLLNLINLKKEGRLKKIIVYGCLVERYRDELLRELPEVDAFIGRISLNHSKHKFRLTPSHYAYLKICEGCINNCSYCVIPKIKGKLASLEFESLLDRARVLDNSGVNELNIIGQDITGYGIDLYKRPRLEELLREILKVTKDIKWVRLLYLYPDRISDELLRIIAGEKRVCKYIDLPLQHINSRLLRLMNRKAGKKEILDLISRIRKLIPGVALRTSLIVGFPSETDTDFQELLTFMDEVRFERLGAFIYSREEGTAAYNLKGQIPQKIKNERFNTLMLKQQEISKAVNQANLGKVFDVLIDEESEDKACYLGRTQHDAPEVDGLVYVRAASKLKPGDLARVKITDTLEYDLVGETI